jgi:restriction endonuclease Mrr
MTIPDFQSMMPPILILIDGKRLAELMINNDIGVAEVSR